MVDPYWLLDPEVIHLNHGSFGATPLPVLEAQTEWRLRFQQDPTNFVVETWEPAIDEARRALADVLGVRAESLGFVPNTTTGVNAVVRSFPLEPGDELLTTDHVYNACRNVLDHVAGRTGSKVVIAPVPFPLQSSDEVVEAVMDRVTARTRFALIDHVTSPTGLVLPAAAIVRLLEDLGVTVMVDGAHSPGMIPLEIEELGPSFYAGNCHKWLCGAPGSAFLWVRSDHVGDVTPAVISHGANDPRTDRPRLHLLFDYPGTIDPSPYLTVPVAIEFLRSLHPDGLDGVMATNRALALKARSLLCETVGTPPAAPDDMIGSLAAVTLPPGSGERPPGFVDPLSRILRQKWNIQVPAFIWPEWPSRNVRVSAAPYNRIEEYVLLSEALEIELAAPA